MLSLQVGGKYYDTEKCREIAEIAFEKLVAGGAIADVRAMAVPRELAVYSHGKAVFVRAHKS